MRVARSRRLVAEGYPLATVARVMQISRQALYRTPTPRTPPQRRPPADPVEQAIVAEALANQSDGYRMVTAFVCRRLGRPVNRKRVLRVLRERKLIQRRRPLERRKRTGFFRVERPRQLWQLDMTSIWVAEHGWCYLNAIIDCCTREIVGWSLELRCRADEAIAVVEQAAAAYGIQPGELVLGSDNGSAFTARRFKARLAELGVRHRRGGYRDPESQAFIESWFGKLKQREVWLSEYETLDDARRGIGSYVDRYHHRPHSSLNYQTPLEIRRTWEDQHFRILAITGFIALLIGHRQADRQPAAAAPRPDVNLFGRAYWQIVTAELALLAIGFAAFAAVGTPSETYRPWTAIIVALHFIAFRKADVWRGNGDS